MPFAVRARVARAGALALALGVAALGAYGGWFAAALPGRLPSPAEWRAAADILAREAQPGDAVALAPWWAERAREVLPASTPVLAFPRLAGEDLPGVRRVWLVSLPRAPGFRRDVERDLAARGVVAGAPRRLGALELARFDLSAPALPLASLPDRLASAAATLGGRPCARASGALRCGAATVDREVREVNLLPRTCVTVRDTAGEPLALSFPAVPLGRALRAHLGVIGEAALAGRAPVRLTVNIAGAGEARAEVAPGDVAWRALEVDTAREAGTAREVTLTLRAARGDGRPLCVDAYALP